MTQSLRYAKRIPLPGEALVETATRLENIKPLVVGDRKGLKNHRFTSWGSIHTRSYNSVWGWECSCAKPLHSTQWYTQKEGLLTCSRSLARDSTLMISRHGRWGLAPFQFATGTDSLKKCRKRIERVPYTIGIFDFQTCSTHFQLAPSLGTQPILTHHQWSLYVTVPFPDGRRLECGFFACGGIGCPAADELRRLESKTANASAVVKVLHIYTIYRYSLHFTSTYIEMYILKCIKHCETIYIQDYTSYSIDMYWPI